MEESFIDPTQAPTQAAQGQLDPNFTADITRRMQVPDRIALAESPGGQRMPPGFRPFGVVHHSPEAFAASMVVPERILATSLPPGTREEEDVLATQSILMDMSRMESFHEATSGTLPPMLGSQHDPSLVASPRVLTLEQLQHLQRGSFQQPPSMLSSYGAAGETESGLPRSAYQPRHIAATPLSKKSHGSSQALAQSELQGDPEVFDPTAIRKQLFAVEKRVRHLEAEQKRQDTLITVGGVLVSAWLLWRLVSYLFGRGGRAGGIDSGPFLRPRP